MVSALIETGSGTVAAGTVASRSERRRDRATLHGVREWTPRV